MRFRTAPCQFKGVDAEWEKREKVECGWLSVPESRGNPTSRTLELWVAIARADAPEPAPDPLLYIHGGPGIGTVDTRVPSFHERPAFPLFRRNRDVIFFDQRGTGRSRPALCPDLNVTFDRLLVEDPPAAVALEQRVEASAKCAAELRAAGGDIGAYNSTATADDADELRRALGYSSWNLLGVSYGTWVALEIVRRHEEAVRSVILDSPYPPNSPFWAEENIYPTGKAYEVVDRECRDDSLCASRFPDVRGALAAAVRILDEEPIPRENGRITGNTFTSALWVLLVRGATVPWVPLVIDHAARGDEEVTRRIVELFGGSGGFGAYSHAQAIAVTCHESLAGPSEGAVREAIRRYPYLVSSDAIAEAQDRICQTLQPHKASPETFAPVRSDRPVLLFTGQFDPATPPEDAYQAARFLPNSTIVAVRGASHAPLHSDDCTRSIALAFLADPTASVDLTCLELRVPFRFRTEGLREFLDSQVGH